MTPQRLMPDAGAPARPSGWQLLRALIGAGLALLAAAAWAPVFGRTADASLADPRLTGSVAGAVAVVTATCLLLAAATEFLPVTRLSFALTTLTGYVFLALAPGRAIVEGPKRLLTTALPIEPAGVELATVVSVIGLVALGAVEPALRRRARLLPMAAPLAAAGLGAAVAASSGPPAWWLAPGLALGAAGLLLARSDRVGAPVSAMAPSGVRAALAAAKTIAVVAVVTLTALQGPTLLEGAGSQQPADARSLVAQPVRPRQAVTPLQLYSALRDGRRTLRLQVHTRQRPHLLRYVSLDQFTGQLWTTSARYLRAGRHLPLSPLEGPSKTHTERVRVVKAGPLGWVVSSGRPTDVSVSGLGVNEHTGDVVFPAGRPAPDEYTVTSEAPSFSQEQLRAATPVARTDTGGPALPPELHAAARAATQGEYGYPALLRLQEHFSSGDFTVDHTKDPPSGHGLYQVRKLLRDKRGTAEQYASGYALLARALGYRARVVVGFRPGKPERPGVYPVTGRDVHAWAEVKFKTLGWAPFDPTPKQVAEGKDKGGASDPADDPSPSPSTSPASSAAPPPVSLDPPAGREDQLLARLRTVAAPAGIGLAALLLVLVCSVPTAKNLRRRRRRRTADPNQRVLAAWRDTVDRLIESGVRLARSDTSTQVVAAARRGLGPEPAGSVAALARLRDRAAYGTAPLPVSTADGAWLHADLARRAIVAALPLPRRVRARFDPRPLYASPLAGRRRLAERPRLTRQRRRRRGLTRPVRPSLNRQRSA